MLPHGENIQHRIDAAVEEHQQDTYIHPRGVLGGVTKDDRR